MSTALEWVDTLAGPGGVVLGIVGTKAFDRRRDRQALQNSKSEETKIDAEAAKIIADTAVALVAPLRDEIQALNERVEKLELENRSTKSLLCLAIDYIRALRMWIFEHVPDKVPPPAPDELVHIAHA